MFRNERFINLYYLGYVMGQDVPIIKDVNKATETDLLMETNQKPALQEILEKVKLLLADAEAVSKKLNNEKSKNEKNKR